MARITISDFNLFLENNSIFDAFWLEYHRACLESNDEGVLVGVKGYRLFISLNPHCFVRTAFIWSKTPQGVSFWGSIDTLWRLRVDAINESIRKSK